MVEDKILGLAAIYLNNQSGYAVDETWQIASVQDWRIINKPDGLVGDKMNFKLGSGSD